MKSGAASVQSRTPGSALVQDHAIRVELSPVLSALTIPVPFRILESLQSVRWVMTAPFLRLESKPPGSRSQKV